MLSFGKVVESPYFRSDRYFQSLFGWFYAMPKDNHFKYENLGRQIEKLHIVDNPQRSLAVGLGVAAGVFNTIGFGILGGAALGVLTAQAFAKDKYPVGVEFADGRYLVVFVERSELLYLIKKSKQVFKIDPN